MTGKMQDVGSNERVMRAEKLAREVYSPEELERVLDTASRLKGGVVEKVVALLLDAYESGRVNDEQLKAQQLGFAANRLQEAQEGFTETVESIDFFASEDPRWPRPQLPLVIIARELASGKEITAEMQEYLDRPGIRECIAV